MIPQCRLRIRAGPAGVTLTVILRPCLEAPGLPPGRAGGATSASASTGSVFFADPVNSLTIPERLDGAR